MVTAFRDALTPELVERATARGLSVRQLVTLASLVEKETAKPEERPIVAAVYSNRLKIGMGMQCDPTVIYALERAGPLHRQPDARGSEVRLALQHLPLCRPAARADRLTRPRVARGRRESGRRAVHLYFVSRNDGSHVFSTTLDEHNRNVFEYQIKPSRRRRAEPV